jgi:hypothetical protein
MSSSIPQLIKVYKAIIHSQEVNVKVYSPGQSRTVAEEPKGVESDEIEIDGVRDELEDKDLTEIFKELEKYVEEEKEEEDTQY